MTRGFINFNCGLDMFQPARIYEYSYNANVSTNLHYWGPGYRVNHVCRIRIDKELRTQIPLSKGRREIQILHPPNLVGTPHTSVL
jgi:hypothetical protein